jgi:hypothetical protein
MIMYSFVILLQKLQQAGIIGVIEGGFCREERVRSARETAKKPVAGNNQQIEKFFLLH